MSFLYADLIGVDIQPVLLAREWTVDRVRQTLEPLAAIAQSIGLGDVGRAPRTSASSSAPTRRSRTGSPGPGLLRRCGLLARGRICGGPSPTPSNSYGGGLTCAYRAADRPTRINPGPHFRQFSAVLEVASAAREAHALPVCAAVNIAGIGATGSTRPIGGACVCAGIRGEPRSRLARALQDARAGPSTRRPGRSRRGLPVAR